MRFRQEVNIFSKDSILKRFQKNETDFSVLSGKISAIISDTDITKYQNGNVTVYKDISEFQQTSKEFQTKVSQDIIDHETRIGNTETLANQTADKFNWVVKSGTDSTNFSLTDRTIEALTENLIIKNKDGGSTIISGGVMNLEEIFAQEITASGTIHGGYFEGTDIYAQRMVAKKEFSLATSTADVERVLYYDGSSVRVGKLLNAASAQSGAGFEFLDTSTTVYGNLNMYSGDISTPGSITATKTITAKGTLYAGYVSVGGNLDAQGYVQCHGLINTYSEYQSQKGERDWRFGSATGTGDQSWFGFYDGTSGWHGGWYGPDHSFRTNGPVMAGGTIRSADANAFRAVYGGYGFIMRNDGANFYFMPTNVNDADGGWNDNYSYVSLATGQWTMKDDKGHRLYPVLTATTDDYRITSLQRSGNNLRFNCGDGVSRYCTGTTSDIRLKDNINAVEILDALSVINSIQLHSFNWKETGEHQRIGFIADELEQLDPKFAVGGGITEDGGIDAKVVDTFYLLGYVVKAIQELSSKVDRLERENEELKRKLYS